MADRYPAVALPNSEVRRLYSAAVGQEYELSVFLPEGYEQSAERYPVLYVTDANWAFMTVYNVVDLTDSLPPMIVVGVGYPEEDVGQIGRLRTRDFLASENKALAPASGGGGRFLSFFREELFPFIDAQYRTDPKDRAGFFYSYGGTFGLYTLFHEPQTFGRYIMGAPDLSWDDEICFAYERAYAEAHTDLPVRLYLAVGTADEDPADRNASSLLRFHAILSRRGYEGLEMALDILNGETHLSGLMPTVRRGVPAVFR